jgi:hypothetical protein
MDAAYTFTDHFTDLNIKLPINSRSASVFNRIFVNGESIQLLENYIQNRCLRSEIIQQNGFIHSVQYHLTKNGVMLDEALVISNGSSTSLYEFNITYVVKDNHEFTTVKNYFDNLLPSQYLAVMEERLNFKQYRLLRQEDWIHQNLLISLSWEKRGSSIFNEISISFNF